jgi:CBS domain-containing protein
MASLAQISRQRKEMRDFDLSQRSGAVTAEDDITGKRSHVMKAADVMATNVITVGPDARVRDVAQILLSARISGVPVVEADGKLVGIVSEGDLMRRVEAGTERRRPWWLVILAGREALAAEFIKEHSRTVADVMTRNVITAAPDTPLSKIANLLEKNAIKRVPIVDDKGKVIGIVSRANLLQALASLSKRVEPASSANDSQIREKVLTQLNAQPWARPSLINVIVQDGNVELWGIVETQLEKKAVRVAAEVTPGVRAINDNLIIRPAPAGY